MTKRKTSPSKENFNQKQYDNFSKVILQFLSGRSYEPMGQTALFKRLNIPPQFHDLCKKIMTDLLREGIVIVNKKQFSMKVEKQETITGTLRVHTRGFGFMVPDHPAESPQDIFIPKHLTDGAVDGDRVEVVVDPESQSEKGPEGRVVSILKRGRTHLAGTIHHFGKKGEMVAYVPLLGSTKPAIVQVPDGTALNIGDRIIMKVVEWGSMQKETICELSHIIGNIEDPSIDNQAAIEEFDLHNIFPKKAIDEALAYGDEVSKADMKGREDFTKVETFTIDPDTAKDFDDALSLQKDENGNYLLIVHIADVAHYVKPGSYLDQEAAVRCNSTYFPGFCLPMLPEELSNNLCSLKAKVIRLTVSVAMMFDKEGTLINHRILRGFIKSAKRFTYEEAFAVIEGKKKSPHSETLLRMVELCRLLKKKRYERGSIDFALSDTFVEINAKGEPIGIKTVEYDISHQLVEEFMLKANEVVAKHLTDAKKPVLYRIHEEPAEENFQDFLALARFLGFTIPEKPTTQDLQKLFELAKNTPFAHQLSVGFIRSMKLACYSAENIGHFGLSLEYYCHFTSPIRRYTDLITERVLFNEEPKDLDFEKIALACSDQERVSFKAESSVKLLKKLRLLQKYFNEDPLRIYPVVVTKIKPFGLFFEMPQIALEGFLHISELGNDYFYHNPERNNLTGRSSGRILSLGDTINVALMSIDCILLETKWMIKK